MLPQHTSRSPLHHYPPAASSNNGMERRAGTELETHTAHVSLYVAHPLSAPTPCWTARNTGIPSQQAPRCPPGLPGTELICSAPPRRAAGTHTTGARAHPTYLQSLANSPTSDPDTSSTSDLPPPEPRRVNQVSTAMSQACAAGQRITSGNPGPDPSSAPPTDFPSISSPHAWIGGGLRESVNVDRNRACQLQPGRSPPHA